MSSGRRHFPAIPGFGLLGLVRLQPIGTELLDTIILIPIIVSLKCFSGSFIGRRSDGSFELLSEMAFGSHMSKKMREITKLGTLGTDPATEGN